MNGYREWSGGAATVGSLACNAADMIFEQSLDKSLQNGDIDHHEDAGRCL